MQIVNGIAILENDKWISKWAVESGRLDHDQNLLPLILPLINEGDTVIDAGAYIGDQTFAYAKKVGKDGLVLAFEPNADAFKCLDYNMSSFSQVRTINAGLSDNLGDSGINKEPYNIGMTYLSEGKGIELLTIDSVYFEQLHFIKIDCEGMELKVLLGGEKTIKNHSPIMLIEINTMTLERAGITRKDIYSLLDEWGYSYKNIYEGQGLEEYQMDIICTK